MRPVVVEGTRMGRRRSALAVAGLTVAGLTVSVLALRFAWILLVVSSAGPGVAAPLEVATDAVAARNRIPARTLMNQQQQQPPQQQQEQQDAPLPPQPVFRGAASSALPLGSSTPPDTSTTALVPEEAPSHPPLTGPQKQEQRQEQEPTKPTHPPPSSTTLPPPPNQDDPSKPFHVVFTTAANATSRVHRVIAENTRVSVLALPRTVLINFDEADPLMVKNQYGFPVLRDMYLRARAMYPTAATYTYMNGDLILSRGFVDTADTLVAASAAGVIKPRFMAIGFRFNVFWDETMALGGTDRRGAPWTFERLMSMSRRFQVDAQDYFLTSRDFWDWTTLPPVVIGRVAYDNYLVVKALNDPSVSLVDVSETNPVVHQTVFSNFAGHMARVRADKDYNNRILAEQDPKWDYGAGKISNARIISRWVMTHEGRKIAVQCRWPVSGYCTGAIAAQSSLAPVTPPKADDSWGASASASASTSAGASSPPSQQASSS